MIDPKIVSACEGFSRGQLEAALELMTEAVQWQIVGDHTVMGKAGVERTCQEAAAQGFPDFVNKKTRVGEDHVIVEGGDRENSIFYCDIYTVSLGRISKITSYGLSASEET